MSNIANTDGPAHNHDGRSINSDCPACIQQPKPTVETSDDDPRPEGAER